MYCEVSGRINGIDKCLICVYAPGTRLTMYVVILTFFFTWPHRRIRTQFSVGAIEGAKIWGKRTHTIVWLFQERPYENILLSLAQSVSLSHSHIRGSAQHILWRPKIKYIFLSYPRTQTIPRPAHCVAHSAGNREPIHTWAASTAPCAHDWLLSRTFFFDARCLINYFSHICNTVLQFSVEQEKWLWKLFNTCFLKKVYVSVASCIRKVCLSAVSGNHSVGI